MSTVNAKQENRYLESPYVIKDTGIAGQIPFSAKNSIEGGSVFSKKGFRSKPFEPPHLKNGDASKKEERRK